MTVALALVAAALAQPAPDVPVVPEVPETPEAPDAPTVRWPTVARMDQTVAIDAPSNDVFAMGQSVSVDAMVGDNAFLMAQNLDVSSPVQGDVYAMAETVTVDAPISGDLYAMGARVLVTPNGSVGGDVHAGAEVLTLRGPVGGDLQAGVGRLELEAPVAGDAELQLGEVSVADGGAIAGALDYASVAPSPALEAVVDGKVAYTEEVVEIEIETDGGAEAEPAPSSGSWLWSTVWWAAMTLWGFLTKLAVGALMLQVTAGQLASVGRRIVSHPGHSLGVGFVTASVLAVGSLLALVTVVPFPLGLLGFAVLGVALYVAQIFAAQALGDGVLRRFRPNALGTPLLSMAVGLAILVVVCSIPWLGGLAWFAATFLGMGAAWSVLRGAR